MPLSCDSALRNGPISHCLFAYNHCLVQAHPLSLRIPVMTSHLQSSHPLTHPLKSCQGSLSKPQNCPCHSVLTIYRVKSKLLHDFSLPSSPTWNSARWSYSGFTFFLLFVTSAPVFKLYLCLECSSESYSPFAWLIPGHHFRLTQVLNLSRSPSLNTPTLSAALVYISTIPLYSLWYNYFCASLPPPLDLNNRKWLDHLKISIFVNESIH